MRKLGLAFMVLALLLLLAPSALGADAQKSVPGVRRESLVSVGSGLYIFDDRAQRELEQRIARLNETYDVHVGIIFLKKLPVGKTAERVAKTVVEGGNGYEQGSKGSMVLLVATESRDYYIATGRHLNRIITSEGGIPYIQEEILPDLKDNDFARAAVVFVDAAEKELAYYEKEGEPYDPANEFNWLACFMALMSSGLIAIGIRSYLISQMSNVRRASDATDYLEEGSFELTEQKDAYLYTHVAVVQKSSSDGGSDSHSDGGGSTGGGGGKF